MASNSSSAMEVNRSRVSLPIAAYLLVVFAPSKVNHAAEPWASQRHTGRRCAGARSNDDVESEEFPPAEGYANWFNPSIAHKSLCS
jgi:hypothetical protein